MASLFEEIKIERPDSIEDLSLQSLEWFRENVRYIKRSSDQLQNENQNFVARPELGRMYMFHYLPKTASKLKYWDYFPLVIVLKRYGTGFLGMNLHYISPRDRSILLNEMYDFLDENEDQPEDTRFKLVYDMVKNISRLNRARPCIKQYIYSNIDSRICQVLPEHFGLVSMLPSTRFQNVNANTVYSDSRKKF